MDDPLVRLRWIVRLPAAEDPQVTIRTAVQPALERSRLIVGEHPYYVSRQWEPDKGRSEAWLTFMVPEPAVSSTRRRVESHLASTEYCESADDEILEEEARWYRDAVRQLTDIALEVLLADVRLPMSEQQAWQDPARAQPALYAVLATASPVYRTASIDATAKEGFWRQFFRPGPSGLSNPGHWLWNIAWRITT